MKLSEMMANIEPEKQYTLYRKIKAAIRDGVLSAVPTFEEVTIHRENKPLNVLDLYMVTNDEKLREWYKEAIRNPQPKTGTARYAVKNPSELTPEELEKRAEEYRASLSKAPTKRKAKK